MLKFKYYGYALIATLSCFSAITYADNAWGGYHSVERRSPRNDQVTQPAPDPFAFSSQRYTPTAPPKGYYYQRNHRPVYNHDQREAFVVGNSLTGEFRNDRYVVRNWSDYSLYEPPRGRHWVLIDGRYLLVTDDHFTIEIIR